MFGKRIKELYETILQMQAKMNEIEAKLNDVQEQSYVIKELFSNGMKQTMREIRPDKYGVPLTTLKEIKYDLKRIENIQDYLGALYKIRDGALILIAVKDTVGYGISAEIAEGFKKLGIETDLKNKHGKSYLAIINKGRVCTDKMSIGDETLQINKNIEGIACQIKSSTYGQENIAIINISNTGNAAINKRGMNIVVFDWESKMIVDSVCFDTHVAWNMCSREGDELEKVLKQSMETKSILELTSKKEEMLLKGVMRQNFDTEKDALKRFFLSMPKADGVLRKLQKVNKILLDAFDEFCRKNEIEYWLGFGALLGAVRHQGFIPWDDDVDICMMREELEKIRKYYTGDEIFEYYDMASRNFNNICYKIRFKNENIPISMDIFVYDYCQEVNEEVVEQNMSIHKEFCREFKKTYYLEDGSYMSNVCENYKEGKHFDVYQKYCEIAKQRLGIVEKERANAVIYAFDNATIKAGIRSSSEREKIFPLTEVVLENHKYYAPKNPEDYCERSYGDIYSIPDDMISHVHFSISMQDEKRFDAILEKYRGNILEGE